MFEDNSARWILALIAITAGLALIFWISAIWIGSPAIEALSGGFTVVLSGLLVVLYWQQKKVLQRQEQIMEADYIPMLSYGDYEFVTTVSQLTLDDSNDIAHESAKFDAFNFGNGRALDIRTEIVVGIDVDLDEGIDDINEGLRKIAKAKGSPKPVTRENQNIENPRNSLEPEESDTFFGKQYFRYSPSNETYESFQEFESHDIETGEYATSLIIVEYKDLLGNSYVDVPYGQVFQYVPNTSLNQFPAFDDEVPHPNYYEFWDLDVE